MVAFDRFDDIPERSYSVICADPPWTFKVYSDETGTGKSAQAHYSCMSIADISVIPVARIAAPDCALFLWATAPLLPDAFEVMSTWGVTYKTHSRL